MKHPLIAYWKAIVWALVILNLSLINVQLFNIPDIINEYRFTDKLVHAFIYMVQCLLILEGGFQRNVKLAKILLSATLLSIAYGFLMELIQYFLIPYRTGDTFDMLANSVGVLLADLFYLIYLYFRPKTNPA